MIAITGLVLVWVISIVIRMIKAGIKGKLFLHCKYGNIKGVKRHLADGANVNEKQYCADEYGPFFLGGDSFALCCS